MPEDFKNQRTFDDRYMTKLIMDELQLYINKLITKAQYDKHLQAIVVSIPSPGLADISLLTPLSATPVTIPNVKVRNNVYVDVDDEVYVTAINGSLNNIFIDFNKSMESYTNSDNVITDTTNFNGWLSSADTDLQKALDTIDNKGIELQRKIRMGVLT
jgi:hypothetical protein